MGGPRCGRDVGAGERWGRFVGREGDGDATAGVAAVADWELVEEVPAADGVDVGEEEGRNRCVNPSTKTKRPCCWRRWRSRPYMCSSVSEPSLPYVSIITRISL